jgi:hypothetical protein
VGFRPELFVAILIKIGDLLDSRPAKNGVVADKRGDIAVGDGVTDGGVDEISEESDTEIN